MLVKRALGVGPPPNDILQFLPFLSMVDAPYAPCKTSLRCGAAAMGCITVLLWYTRYNYAPLKRALRNNRKGIMIYLFFNIISGNGGGSQI